MLVTARLKYVAESEWDSRRYLDVTLLEGWLHRGRAYGSVRKCARILTIPLCLSARSEGFSTTSLEASACDCPSLVTDVGGARELVPDESCGRIMPDAPTATVMQGIISLRGHPSSLSLMSESYRLLVKERFGWNAAVFTEENAHYPICV